MPREIYKRGVLQQKRTETKAGRPLLSSKKVVVYLPEKLHVLCIHDNLIPFLELYGNEKEVLNHVPQQVLDLLHCSYISKVVEDDRTFIIGFDDSARPPLELTALSADECDEWVSVLNRELSRLNCLPEQDNLYVPLPLTENREYTPLAWADIDRNRSSQNLNERLNPDTSPTTDYNASVSALCTSIGQTNNDPNGYYECISTSRMSPPSSLRSFPDCDGNHENHNTNQKSPCVVAPQRQNSQQLPPLPPKIKPKSPPVNADPSIYDDLCSPAGSSLNDYCTLSRKHDDQSGSSVSKERRSLELEYDDLILKNSPNSLSLVEKSSGEHSIEPREHDYINMKADSVQLAENFNSTVITSPPLPPPNRYSEVRPPRPLNRADLARLTKNVCLKRQQHQQQAVPMTSSSSTMTSCSSAHANLIVQDHVTALNQHHVTPSFLQDAVAASNLESDQSVTTGNSTALSDDEMMEVPLAPRNAPPAVPARPIGGAAAVGFVDPSTPIRSPSLKTVSTRTTTNQKRSVKENDVIKLNSEIDADLPIRVTASPESVIRGLALVEFDNAIWVAGWNVKYNAVFSAGFHVGDKLLAVNGHFVSPKFEDTKRLIDSFAFAGPLELTLKRLPYGRAFILKRLTDGEKLGIIRKKSKNEIIEIEANSLAALAGMPPKAQIYTTPTSTAEVNWFITEINGRPINLIAKNNEAGERLSAVGYDISLVVQPVNFVKLLRKCLKQQKKNYRDYIIGC